MSETTHPAGQSFEEVMERILARQKARGYVPRSAEEIQEQLRQSAEEWEERDREIEAVRQGRDPYAEAAQREANQNDG